MDTTTLLSYSLGQIVTQDFRAGEILEKYSLDYCCGGSKKLQEACVEENIPIEIVLFELLALTTKSTTDVRFFDKMPLNELIDYILKVHHTYVREQIPVLLLQTAKIARVHGQNHPELIEIARIFKAIADELQSHMQKEETILFPTIKQVLGIDGETGNGSIDTIQSTIRTMAMEHDSAGTLLHQIAALSNHYNCPADGCNTYQATMKGLQAFERDLHKHVHLENNILFPKSIETCK